MLRRTPLAVADRPEHFASPSPDQLAQKLAETYREAARHHTDPYVERHGQGNSLRRQVDAFLRYRDYVATDATVLEWGCKHAPDACLLRAELGDGVRIIGYDFDRGDAYLPFYEAAQLDFHQADHPYVLPFADESVDVIVGSGVLEHVANPAASLTELHRVLAVGGVIVITFLPNRWSYTEWLLRTSGSRFHHRRRYTRSSMRRLLLDHGFEPQVDGYHQFVPGQRGGRLAAAMWRWNGWLEQAVPSKYFSANLYAVAVKRRAI